MNHLIAEKVEANEIMPQDIQEVADRAKDVLRHALHKKNKDFESKCWMSNALQVIDTMRITMPCTKIQGFVQRFQTAPDFAMTMHCERQLAAIKHVPPHLRVLHIDASGPYNTNLFNYQIINIFTIKTISIYFVNDIYFYFINDKFNE